MQAQVLCSTAELMLEQVMGTITMYCPKVDNQGLRDSLITVFLQYEVRPAPSLEGHPDLREKIQLFISGKRLEGLSEQTLKGYQMELRAFSKLAAKPAEEVTTNDIRNYLGQFRSHKISTLSGKLSVLKSFFGWLSDEEIIAKDPTKKIKPPKKEKRLPKALSVGEFELLRESYRTLRERAMVEVLYATGCRLSELAEMNRSGIDWQRMSYRVIGKGNKEREVFFSEKSFYHLRKYLMQRADNEDALFITHRKPYRRVSNRAIQREIGIIAKRTGLSKRIHPHVLRHTFATDLLNNGADLALVQALMGHDDPATTLVYTNISDERKRQAHRQYHAQ